MKNDMIYIGSKQNKLILWTTTNYWICFFKSITNNYYKIHFKYVGFIKVT